MKVLFINITLRLWISYFVPALLVTMINTGCVGAYKQASYVSSQARLGMTIEEFKKLAGRKASLEVMESGYTVFRMNDYDAWTGARIDTKFYYFDAVGKLVKIDGGEFKQKRYQIEIIK